MKVIFLDRDGTINKDYPDEEWKGKKIPEILPGTITALKTFISNGYKLIIITNQYIISDNIISLDDYKTFNDNLINVLKENGIEILKTYYCPHNDIDNCNCKKPKTGMIDKALTEFDIDIKRSIYCGDSVSDMELAKKFGLNFFGINLECKNKVSNLLEVCKILNIPIKY